MALTLPVLLPVAGSEVVVCPAVVGTLPVVVVSPDVVVVVPDCVPQTNQWLMDGFWPPSLSGGRRSSHGGLAGNPSSPGTYRFVSGPPFT